jgi:hypothetical protein
MPLVKERLLGGQDRLRTGLAGIGQRDHEGAEKGFVRDLAQGLPATPLRVGGKLDNLAAGRLLRAERIGQRGRNVGGDDAE